MKRDFTLIRRLFYVVAIIIVLLPCGIVLKSFFICALTVQACLFTKKHDTEYDTEFKKLDSAYKTLNNVLILKKGATDASYSDIRENLVNVEEYYTTRNYSDIKPTEGATFAGRVILQVLYKYVYTMNYRNVMDVVRMTLPNDTILEFDEHNYVFNFHNLIPICVRDEDWLSKYENVTSVTHITQSDVSCMKDSYYIVKNADSTFLTAYHVTKDGNFENVFGLDMNTAIHLAIQELIHNAVEAITYMQKNSKTYELAADRYRVVEHNRADAALCFCAVFGDAVLVQSLLDTPWCNPKLDAWGMQATYAFSLRCLRHFEEYMLLKYPTEMAHEAQKLYDNI